MIVASGTSTPTSITVVATRIFVSPSLKARIASSFSAPCMRPCTQPDDIAEFVLQRRRNVPRPTSALISSDPRPAGRSSRPSGPPRSHPKSARSIGPMRSNGSVTVRIGWRPAGFSVSRDDVHVAEGGQHQRARDRRRRHHQHIGRIALGGDRQPLVDAEAVLLVDHREARGRETSHAPGTAHACRPPDRSTPSSSPASVAVRSRPFSRPVRIATLSARRARRAA